MTQTRALVSVLCAVILLVLAAGSQAQVIPRQNTNLGVTGEITALDLGAKTLTVIGPNKDGGMFMTNKDTIIMNGDKNVSLADLKKGWHVEVSFDNVTGKNIAHYITVVDTGN
ncbi:MAG TPA: hypothetical protein VK714_09040 [Myxococcota bacterium]|nr:hypothetical protein [Myxococcota bacterium]